MVELIKVIRAPRLESATDVKPPIRYMDSCQVRNLADIRFKNKTGKTVEVYLFQRNGNSYTDKPLILTLAGFSQESLFELIAGIYKYKVETLENEESITLHQGELRLNPCDNLLREIK